MRGVGIGTEVPPIVTVYESCGSYFLLFGRRAATAAAFRGIGGGGGGSGVRDLLRCADRRGRDGDGVRESPVYRKIIGIGGLYFVQKLLFRQYLYLKQ
jgi:hypothetical protein